METLVNWVLIPVTAIAVFLAATAVMRLAGALWPLPKDGA